MTDEAAPTSRNRLGNADSPYLTQHADNPVHWQPWDEAARAAARERDVPIFLSIGYSACHWCHVMEAESFADETVAEKLNADFVPIKVDREERPDLDAVYMSICQQVTGRGGWPLSAWLLPDGRPFYVGTYFPREPKRGMPGFLDLLEDIANSWADPDQRADIEERAGQWTEAIESDLGATPADGDGTPDESVLRSAADVATRAADRDHGGWGSQKFPHSRRLELLLIASDVAGRDAYGQVAGETLRAMAEGGLFDHVGGGFHRYCTDREWVVPHFEKMLYDNAEIPRAMLAGYQVLGDERFAAASRRTFEFARRELRHDGGGFYSTLDAESPVEGDDSEEGAFYVWTPDQVHDAVEDERAADLFCDRYGVTESGNFEGATVLTVSRSVPDLAESVSMDERRVRETLDRARRQVFAAREDRPRPARDEKILAGWNGLLVSALAEGSIVLDQGLAATARDALSFVREHLWDDESTSLARRYRDGNVGIDGYLEDYAFLARGALDCYGATGDLAPLGFALDLARGIEREFWDEERNTLYFTPASGESLVARPQELTDQSTPSSAGVAARVLLDLDHFVGHDRFETIAARTLSTHADHLEANPMEHASLVLAADQYARGAVEVTLAAEERPDEWRRTLAETFVPHRLLAPRPARDADLADWLDELGLSDTPPIWAGRGRKDDEPTAYVCRDFACSPPERDLATALAWDGPDG